jgi:hypothetical protein
MDPAHEPNDDLDYELDSDLSRPLDWVCSESPAEGYFPATCEYESFVCHDYFLATSALKHKSLVSRYCEPHLGTDQLTCYEGTRGKQESPTSVLNIHMICPVSPQNEKKAAAELVPAAKYSTYWPEEELIFELEL